MRTIQLHARDWEEMAAVDPLWAILSNPEKRFGNWNLNEFLSTGEQEIASLMQSADKLGLPKQHRRAIDFGCGVGRLTHALCAHFPECHGVDISHSMLESARRLAPNCHFREASDLTSFPDGYADLVYSSMVLQHQPQRQHVAALVADMIRVLAPNGLLVFQMPLYIPWRNRLQLRRRAYRLLHAFGLRYTFAYERLKLNPIRMLSLPQASVEEIVSAANGMVVHVTHTRQFSAPFTSGIYYCTVRT